MNSGKSSKALLLVGGYGTRLRPLTFSKPKPLVEFINKPILSHQIEALKSVGVDEIVLAINYQPEKMLDYIKEAESKYNIKITCSKEEEPLGTAGPIGLAKNILQKSDSDEIFVFNSDITCRFPLREMLEFHRFHKKEGTIATTIVKEPSKFGVILSDENKKILDFVEKPPVFVGDNINAGLYIFNKKFLDRVEAKPISIEREIFPKMAKEGELYIFPLEGFWADIGQPPEYLIGTKLFLNDAAATKGIVDIVKCNNIVGNVLIDSSAEIDKDSLIGPNVVIGPEVVIKKGVRIKDSVIMGKCVINESAYVEGSIIGWKSKIGRWVRIDGLCVLGEDVTISDEVHLASQTIILPNVTVKNNTKSGSTILC